MLREGAARAPRDAIVTNRGEEARALELRPGERVAGRGERTGVVYRLADGRTIIVRRRPAERP